MLQIGMLVDGGSITGGGGGGVHMGTPPSRVEIVDGVNNADKV